MPVSTLPRISSGGLGIPRLDNTSVFYAPLWRPDMVAVGGYIANGTGIATGNPFNLVVGANTIIVTQAGTFVVSMPEGGTVASGTMTVTASPVTIPAGVPTTITTTGATGNITVTVSNIIRSKDRNNHALIIVGATWGNTGRTTNGDDYINCGSSSVFNFTNALTIIAAIKIANLSATQLIMGNYIPATSGWAMYVNTTGKWVIRLEGCSLTNPTSTSAITAGAWAIIAATYDGSNATFYFNGIADASPPAVTGNITTPTQATWIGERPDGLIPYSGVIGEVLLYNRVLTANGQQNVYLSLKGRYGL